jgi:hypothetical protein
MIGTIERRLLVNYRVDGSALAEILPSPFRPQLIEGYGVAGICLIRLSHLRPAGLPAWIGVTTENAAHRIAVEWDGPDGPCPGVYIPRRDTASPLTVLLGGRLFPGEHHRAHFAVDERNGRYDVGFESHDGCARVLLRGEVCDDLAPGSIFGSLDEASRFFRAAPLGYSAVRRGDRCHGLELQCETWHVEPLQVEHVASSFFEDSSHFPPGTVEFDSALVMRNIPAAWRPRDSLETGGRLTASPVATAEALSSCA